jgi:hypothetical protein
LLTPARKTALHRADRPARHALWATTGLALMATVVVVGGDNTASADRLVHTSADSHQHTHTTRTHTHTDPRPGPQRVSRSSGSTRGVVHREPQPVRETGKRDAAQTARAAERVTRNPPGYCLQWVHQRAGIPAKYLSASEAWQHAGHKHRGDRTPPVGAAVYWTGGSHGYGHIAISVGHGKVRSTDAGGEGRVATVPVGWAHRAWGLHYAGWSSSLNGYTIPGVAGHHADATHGAARTAWK